MYGKMNNKEKKRQEAIEVICSMMGITEEEENFYATYNPMRLYEKLLDFKIPSQEVKELLRDYQPFYDKIIERIRRYQG